MKMGTSMREETVEANGAKVLRRREMRTPDGAWEVFFIGMVCETLAGHALPEVEYGFFDSKAEGLAWVRGEATDKPVR